MNFLEKYRGLIKEEIIKNAFNTAPEELYEPMNYILDLGGKHLRPVLVLMTYHLFKEDYYKVIKPALGIEYFHNFSLMHDDIMDKAPLRRGKPTVHKKFNENTAILSGDALLVKSFQMLEDLEPQLFKPCFQLFSETALKVCEGQQYDMNFETQNKVSFDEYIHMITGKTAVLCACSMKMGALLAETSSENASNLYEFGKYLGIAFQFMDDYLDVFGEQQEVGKKYAGDIYENKKTILYILAEENANPEEKKELQYWYEIREESQEKISNVVQLFKKLKVDRKCLELVNEYNNQAKKHLNAINLTEEKKQPLLTLIDNLLIRKS
ncbi:polyprenyl synthetase family protein [Apibacter muscae]|uniref:Polyprenyl synthetase family protein n=1 Tax=Apibacter muscae TaxID=2509004 RepID=A0A563DI21_9FLAO|nr:polyprenyl synthetase family protein [Apibacter muscae]TWP29464.1 polyprenyl synthetase family protein [Apibacter muscae]TWP30130.1 polyprenyl synthetase family protein [Apibacter muscae]